MTTGPDRAGLDTAGLDWAGLVAQALGTPQDPSALSVTTVPYPLAAPATGGLYRVAGRDALGQPWRRFVKILQHPRHWSLLPLLPPDVAQQFATEFPWRSELDLWSPAFGSWLPPGLRTPRDLCVLDLGDDRLAVFSEDVVVDPSPWTLPRYARVARLLGALAAASGTPEAVAGCPFRPGHGLRMYVESSVRLRGMPPLADDTLWDQPALAGWGALRHRLQRLGASSDALLDRLDALPQAMPHGDATPANLLVPADAPETFVLIDISFTTPHAVGFDLGQLLVGLVQAGSAPADGLPALADTILPAFVEGHRAAGGPATAGQVAEGFWFSTLLRSGIDTIPYELAGSTDPTERAQLQTRLATADLISTRAATLLDG